MYNFRFSFLQNYATRKFTNYFFFHLDDVSSISMVVNRNSLEKKTLKTTCFTLTYTINYAKFLAKINTF